MHNLAELIYSGCSDEGGNQESVFPVYHFNKLLIQKGRREAFVSQKKALIRNINYKTYFNILNMSLKSAHYYIHKLALLNN